MNNICVLRHNKIGMFQLTKVGISFLSFICSCMLCSKRRICKENKSKNNQNAFNMIASVFLGDVRVIGCTSKMILPIKQLWLCVSVFDSPHQLPFGSLTFVELLSSRSQSQWIENLLKIYRPDIKSLDGLRSYREEI